MNTFLLLLLLSLALTSAGPIAGVSCLVGVCGIWSAFCIASGPGYVACITVTCGSYMPICTAAFIAPTP